MLQVSVDSILYFISTSITRGEDLKFNKGREAKRYFSSVLFFFVIKKKTVLNNC